MYYTYSLSDNILDGRNELADNPERADYGPS